MFGKKFWIGASIVAGFAVGAIVYGYFTKQDIRFQQLRQQLQQIVPVKRNQDGTLRSQFFCKFFATITKYGKKASAQKKKEFLIKRLQCLENNQEAQYRKVITEQIMAEEQVFQEIASYSLNQLGIKDEEFLMSQQQNMNNPQFQKVMMESQINSSGDDNDTKLPEDLTKQKTIEIYKFLTEKKKQVMIKQMRAQQSGQEAADPTLEMMVCQCKIADSITQKFGVDEEQFAKALQHFNVMDDPQIRKIHQMEQMMQMLQNGGGQMMQMLQNGGGQMMMG